MSLLLEAFWVGLYTTFIGYCVQLFMEINTSTITGAYFYLCVVGFFKHLMGYFLHIHDYYCNVCNKANRITNMKTHNLLTNVHVYAYAYVSNSSLLELIFESCVEGIIFILLGMFAISAIGVSMLNKNNNKNKGIFLFLIGFLLHYISDFVGIHDLFCKYRCVKS